MQGPGYCGQLGEVRPPAVHSYPVFVYADDMSLEKVVPSKARLTCFQEVATSFFHRPCGNSCWVTWLRWSGFSLGVIHVCARCSGASRTTGPPWSTILLFGSLCQKSAWRRFIGGSGRTGGLFGVPLQVPPPSLLLHIDVCVSGWGAHLLGLTVSGVWS